MSRKGIDDFCALANRTQARLDAAYERETRLREALTALSHYVEHHVVMPLHRHADYPLIGDCTKLCDEADSLGREVVAKLAALSAGAGEK